MKNKLVLFLAVLVVLLVQIVSAEAITACDAILSPTTPHLVDDNDQSVLFSAMESKEGDAKYNPKADFNHDKKVDFDDFFLFVDVSGLSCNRAPSIDVPTLTIAEDSGVTTIDLRQYSSDPEGDGLTYVINTRSKTKVDCTIDGINLKLTTASNFNGQSQCSLRARDQYGAYSGQDYFDITVNSVDDSAVWQSLSGKEINEDSSDDTVIYPALKSLCSDIDSDTSFGITSTHDHFNLYFDADGNLRIRNLQANWNGVETVNVGCNSVGSSFVLTVRSVNDAAVWQSLSNKEIDEDSAEDTIAYPNLESQSSDVDDSLYITVTSRSNHFDLYLDFEGNLRIYNLEPNWYGVETVNLDSNGVTASFVLTVRPVNDAPTSWISIPRDFITTETHPAPFIRKATGELIYFAGHGSDPNDPEGTIVDYNWNFDGATPNSPDIDPLVILSTAGEYNVQFKAKDNNNAWSEPFPLNLVVDSKPTLNLEPYLESSTRIPDINNIVINPGTLIWFKVMGNEPDRAVMNDYVKEIRVEYGDGSLYYEPYFSNPGNVQVTRNSDSVYSYKLINNDDSFFSEVKLTYGSIGDRTIRFVPIDTYGMEGDPIDVRVSVVNPPPPPPPPNDAPVANDDSISTPEDTSALIDVLTNDNDIQDGKPTIDSVASSPSKGTAVIESGKIRYTPNANVFGSDSFTYRVKDSRGEADTAIVNIVVSSVNDNPAANDDIVSVVEDSSVLIDVLSNDFDVEDGISINSVGSPSHGSAVIESGKIRYTPNADYHGTDSFTYQLIDNEMATDSATVTITVIGVNDGLPVATNDIITINEDNSILIDVLANDNDVDDGKPAIDAITSGPSKGTAVIESGKIMYTPNANVFGADSFTYRVKDSDGAAATATVSITVNSVNDNPIANADSANIPEDTAVLIDVLVNDNDVEGALTIDSVSVPGNGIAAIVSGKVSYTPNVNFHGTNSFTYTVKDTDSATTTATITVNVGSVNDAPTLNSGVTPATGNKNTDFTYDVTYTDADNDAPVFVKVYIDGTPFVMAPANPADTDYTNGAMFVYTKKMPLGSHGFYFEASDGTVTVTSTTYSGPTVSNSGPVLNAIGNKNANEGSLLQFTLIGSDPDGDALTFSASNLPSGATVDPNTGVFAWTPGFVQQGAHSVDFRASDGTLTASETVVITVSNINRAPVITPIGNKNVNENSLLSFTVVASDPDGDSLTYTSSQLPAGASFNTATHVFTWTPDFSQSGSYTVRFGASDAVTETVEQITITVGNVNGPPGLNAIGDKEFVENNELRFTISANDPDSGDVLTYSASNLPTGASFSPATRTFSWTPGFDQNGIYRNVHFEARDGSLVDSEDITIVVINKDRNPTVTTSPLKEITVESPTMSTLYQYNVDATDEDGDSLQYTLQDKPVGMSIDSSTGLITWSADKKDKGKHNVKVVVYDSKGGYAIQAFELKVNLGKDVEGTDSNDVNIAKIELVGGESYAPGSVVKIGVGFTNTGDKNVRDLKATVSMPELGISRKVGPLYLESGKSETRYTFIELPEDLKPGEYILRVRSSSSSKAKHRFIIVE